MSVFEMLRSRVSIKSMSRQIKTPRPNFNFLSHFDFLFRLKERQLKSEIEVRRKKEDEEMTRQMEVDRMAAEKLQVINVKYSSSRLM